MRGRRGDLSLSLSLSLWALPCSPKEGESAIFVTFSLSCQRWKSLLGNIALRYTQGEGEKSYQSIDRLSVSLSAEVAYNLNFQRSLPVTRENSVLGRYIKIVIMFPILLGFWNLFLRLEGKFSNSKRYHSIWNRSILTTQACILRRPVGAGVLDSDLLCILTNNRVLSTLLLLSI